MRRIMLRSKIHRARVTGTLLGYEGSIALDESLMDAAGMLPHEQVQVLNLATGARLTTYIIKADRESGTVMLNGPAARLAEPGDEIIILTYGDLGEEEALTHQPCIVHVDETNRLCLP